MRLAIVALLAPGCADVEALTLAPLTASPCTAVALTTPGAGFAAQVGAPLTLAGVATCPAGVVPEYQFWVKPAGAPNWTIASAYLPGLFAWIPDTTGDWCTSVVVRAVGSATGPDSFQARSAARCGTISGTATTTGTGTVRVGVPLHASLNASVFPGQFLHTFVTNGSSLGIVVQIPAIPVGSTIVGLEARVRDSVTGPTTATLGFADQVDNGFQEPALPPSAPSNGSGQFQTLSIPSIARVVAPLHTYYAGVFVTSGVGDVSVSAIDLIYLPEPAP